MCCGAVHTSCSLTCASFCKKRKENTTLLSVIKEKLMVNLSFPLAWANIKGEGGGASFCNMPHRFEITLKHCTLM